MGIEQFFIKGDMKGAIEYMRNNEGFEDILPAYESIFEREEYRKFGLNEPLEQILLAYQVYYRNVFYLGIAETEAAECLRSTIGTLLNMTGAEENELVERLKNLFEENGYHTVFGKTQGVYGPYIWKETKAVTYTVELPCGTADYTVNILKGFVFRSWMDYLTFGNFGTGGWAGEDGTINCIEQAYDFESEKFLISLLKHEAQHTLDFKKYPGILSSELEYRAKLVELCYTSNPSVLQKYISEADENKRNDGHAMASVRLKKEFANCTDIKEIQKRAFELFFSHNQEMDEKYL